MSELMGELVILSGGAAGDAPRRVGLAAAVTALGSDPACDVPLDGLEPWHCVVAHTPAGPVLRSWHPQHTRLNGEPTAAALLHHGDRLDLGAAEAAHHVEFHWRWPDAAPQALDPEEAPASTPIPAPSPAEQNAELAALIEHRHSQLAVWFEDLKVARESLRQRGREKLRAARAAERAAAVLNRSAEADRVRARRLARRWVKRWQARHAAEREALVAGRVELARREADLQARQDRARLAHAQKEYAVAEGDRRLREAWTLAAENQRRAQADRSAAEAHVKAERDAVAAREAEVARAWAALDAERRPLVAQAEALRAEVARLDARAERTQAVLARLNAERESPLGAGAPPGAVALKLTGGVVVPAEPQDVGELLAELNREQRSLNTVRGELERRAADLHDERVVVAEQLAAVAVARHSWRSLEVATVDELQSLAQALVQRESTLDARERAVAAAEADATEHAQNLWRLRLKLEAWQSALATHEAAAAHDRHRAEAEAAARDEQLSTWEASLAGLSAQWAAQRKQELWQLRDELGRLTAAQARYRLAAAEADGLRDTMLTATAEAAAATLAAGEVQTRLTGPLVKRRLRLAQRRWERHFRHYRQDLDARRQALAAEAAQSDRRLRVSTEAMLKSREEHAALSEERERAAREAVERARQLDARAAEVAVETAHAQEAQLELLAVRAEVERMATILMTTEPPAPEFAPLTAVPVLSLGAPAA